MVATLTLSNLPPGDGSDNTIVDFQRGVDKIDLTAYRSLVFLTTKEGDDNTIDLGSTEITLTGITVDSLTAADVMFYNRDADNTLNGNNSANTIWGGRGDDRIDGKGGDDKLEGGEGDDTVIGGAGADMLDGGENNDGTQDSDTLSYSRFTQG